MQEESEFIQPVAAVKRGDAAAAGGVPPGGMVVGRGRGDTVGHMQAQNGAGGQPVAGGPRPPRQIDPRLAEIYAHERVVVNRNTALRGAKPMVCPSDSPPLLHVFC